MNGTRFKLLGGAAALLACLVIWNVIANWGLVTLNVNGAPLSKVIRSIERQGHVKIASNLDPETPVSLQVHRVPVSEALDLLATRVEGNWRLAYAAAGNKEDLERIVSRYRYENRRSDDRDRSRDQAQAGGGNQPGNRDQQRDEIDTETFYFPMGFNEFLTEDMAVPDPRKIEWTVSPLDERSLHAYLNQFAQKTGAMAVTPEEWNPEVKSVPKKGRVPEVIQKLVKSAGGKVQEIFILTRFGRGGGGGGDVIAAAFGGGGGWGGRGGGSGGDGNRPQRPALNEEWINERVTGMIRQLPEDRQEQARKDYEEVRDFWKSVQPLPEDQRRMAAAEFFNSPGMQERMADRTDRRDGRRTPEQRVQRQKDYVERKQTIKQQQSDGL